MLMPGRGHRPRSIQFWLTCLVVACILPPALGVGFLVVRSYEQERSNLETARIGVARALMQVVDGEVGSAASVLQVMALSSFLEAGDFAGFQGRAAKALATTSGNSIALFDRDGEQIINTLYPFGTTLPRIGDDDLQRRTLESSRPVISDVFFGPAAGQPLIAVQVPVTVRGQVKYTLAMGFFSARLVDILHRQKLPEGWVAAIYDSHGVIAARTHAAEQFAGKPGSDAAVRHIAERPEGTFDSVTLEGVPAHATFSRSTVSGWVVVIAVPAAIATSDLKDQLWLNAAGAMAALLLGAALARYVARRISRSITILGEPALVLVSDGPVLLPPIDITEVEALRTVLLKAAHIIEQERDAARDAERRTLIAARAAEKANRAKSDFLASMSHELRTPLHGILGYTEMLRIEGALTPTQATRVEAMLGAGQHLLGMINSVLDMARIEANHMELQPRPIELPAFVRACLDVIRPAAKDKGLTLAAAPTEPLRMVADPTRLRQVLVNLLGNAVKFTPSGTIELRLRLTRDGSRLLMEVADTGPGVPAEHREKLFRNFERLDGKALNAVEGAGIGLALSARLVALMGGCLRYDDNPGGGSIFWLELPVGDTPAMLAQNPASGEVTDDPPPARSMPAKSPPTRVMPPQNLPAEKMPARVMHVLVVDDVAMNRDIASAFLRAAGHRVSSAASGEDAITAVSATDFDVVLMDVRMPGMDGLEATRRIRSLTGARGRVSIVAVTAQAFAAQVAECHAAGMDSHLAKPFDQDSLLAAIMRPVASKQLHDQLS